VTIEEIQEIIFRLRDRGIGILITDHNVGATLRITDRNYILIDGQIISQGTGAEIAADEHVRKHYLGQQFVHDPESDRSNTAEDRRREKRRKADLAEPPTEDKGGQ
jgi:ABC-type multidrug transport system ATPase subunit